MSRSRADRQPNELLFRCKVYENKKLRDVGMAYFTRHKDANGIWDGRYWDLVTLDPKTEERVILAEEVEDEDIPRLPWNYMISPAIVRKRKNGVTDVAMNIRRNYRFDRVTVEPISEEWKNQ